MKPIENESKTFYQVGQTLRFRETTTFRVLGFTPCEGKKFPACPRCSGNYLITDDDTGVWHDVEGDFEILRNQL